MTGDRRYPPAQKARVVAYAAEHGANAASREYGMPAGTVSTWCKQAGVKLVDTDKMAAARQAELARRERKREQLRTLLLDEAVTLIERMGEPSIDFRGKDAEQVTYPRAPAADCQRYATAAAILIDKYRLEAGEATERTEWNDQRERALADARDRALRLVDRDTG